MNEPELILASSSPRRRELLALLKRPFRIEVPQVDEIPLKGELPGDFALRAARDKAVWVASQQTTAAVVVGADTVVTIDERILGKPTDATDARAMLSALKGRRHEVLTGLCVVRRGADGTLEEEGLLVRTAVEMTDVSAEEITRYVESGEPMDKAGSYAIQGGAAYMVQSIKGSYTNVVGLPLAELNAMLARHM